MHEAGSQARIRPLALTPDATRSTGGNPVGLTEYVLLALVILVPLVIAVAVTLWSLEQARYRPKRSRPRPTEGQDRPPAGTDPVPPPPA